MSNPTIDIEEELALARRIGSLRKAQSSELYDGSKTEPRPGGRKRKSRRKTDAPDAIRQQLQFLEDQVSESTDVDSKSDVERKKKKSRKSRRKTAKVNYEEMNEAADSDSDLIKNSKELSGRSSRSHADAENDSSSDVEKDWLELRSRKVLQSGPDNDDDDDDEVSTETATAVKLQKRAEKATVSSEDDIPSEDFEETLEKEDWLILRNRKILQESDEPEVEKVTKPLSGNKSKGKRKRRTSGLDSSETVKSSLSGSENKNEDWLELRSRKVLQSEDTEAGVEQEVTRKLQFGKSVKRRRKEVSHPTSSSDDDAVRAEMKHPNNQSKDEKQDDNEEDILQLRSRNIMQPIASGQEDEEETEVSDPVKSQYKSNVAIIPCSVVLESPPEDSAQHNEEDWLELRSRKVLQPVENKEQEDMQEEDEGDQPIQSQSEDNEAIISCSAVLESIAKDGEQQEGKDWLELRSRKVLQPTEDVDDEQEVAQLEDEIEASETDKSAFNDNEAITSSSTMIENSIDVAQNVEEDWLELRSRKVLQSVEVVSNEESDIVVVPTVTEVSHPLSQTIIEPQLASDIKEQQSQDSNKIRDENEVCTPVNLHTQENEEVNASLAVIDSPVDDAAQAMEEDFLELRSRKVLQSVEILKDETAKEIPETESNIHVARNEIEGPEVDNQQSGSSSQSQYEVIDTTAEDSAQLEGKDWLELRSRKVLQTTEGEEQEVLQLVDETGSSETAKPYNVDSEATISSFAGIENSANVTQNEEEDWLELRSRKVLQSVEVVSDEELGKEVAEPPSHVIVEPHPALSLIGQESQDAEESRKENELSESNPAHAQENEDINAGLAVIETPADDAAQNMEDWLELRSRKVLQSVEILKDESAKENSVTECNKNENLGTEAVTEQSESSIQSQYEDNGTIETPAEDSAQLDGTDWLELRSRKVLQSVEGEEQEVVQVEDEIEASDLPESLTKDSEATISSSSGIENSANDIQNEEEDWLELRSRQVLQTVEVVSSEECDKEVSQLPSPIMEYTGTNKSKEASLTSHSVSDDHSQDSQAEQNIQSAQSEISHDSDDYIDLRSRDVLQSSSRQNSKRGKPKGANADVQSLLVNTSEPPHITCEYEVEHELVEDNVAHNEGIDKVDQMIESAWKEGLESLKANHEEKTKNENLFSNIIAEADTTTEQRSLESALEKDMPIGLEAGSTESEKTDQQPEFANPIGKDGEMMTLTGKLDLVDKHVERAEQMETGKVEIGEDPNSRENEEYAAEGDSGGEVDSGDEERSSDNEEKEKEEEEEDDEEDDEEEEAEREVMEVEENEGNESDIPNGREKGAELIEEILEDESVIKETEIIEEAVLEDRNYEDGREQEIRAVLKKQQTGNMKDSQSVSCTIAEQYLQDVKSAVRVSEKISGTMESKSLECNNEEESVPLHEPTRAYSEAVFVQSGTTNALFTEENASSSEADNDVYTNNNEVKKQLFIESFELNQDQPATTEIQDTLDESMTSFNMTGDLSTIDYADVHDILNAWLAACQQSIHSLSSDKWADAEVEKYSVDIGEGVKFGVASKYHSGSLANLFDDVIQLNVDILCLQVEQWIPFIPEEDVNGVLAKFGVRALLNHDKETGAATVTCFSNKNFPVARSRSCLINVSDHDQQAAHGLLQITALQQKNGGAFCLGNLLLPQKDEVLAQDLQSYILSVSFGHLLEAAGGTFNPLLLAAHLHNLDTSSEEYTEAMQGYLSYQHSTLLPISAYKKVLGNEGLETDFLLFSDESVRLHRVAQTKSGNLRQAVFSLGKGMFSHVSRVVLGAPVVGNALMERIGEQCSLPECSMSLSPIKIEPGKLFEHQEDTSKHSFQTPDRNRFWPWI